LTISNRSGTASPVKGKLQQHLTPLPEALLLAVPMLLGAACAAIQRDTEQMLVAAGFHMRPTDTTELQEDLRSIPPHRLVSRTKDGNVVYMYADPDNWSTSVAGWRGNSNRRQEQQEGRREHRVVTVTGGRDGATATGRGLKLATLPSSGSASGRPR
jgi:hypothetical protein